MNVLLKINNSFNKLETVLLIFLLSVMVVLSFWQVVLRNLFSGGYIWADILLRHIVLWLGFLGGALATSTERHIHIDALAHFLPGRVRSFVGIFTNLFGAAVCYLLLQASITFIQVEIDAKSVVFEGIPSWYAQIIIPAGFGLHIIHFVLRSGMDGLKAMKKELSA